ncbi:MAG: glycosyltransferase family 4 protein [Fusobacteriaceae bacterium]|jgi:glycosyltransferase involved in cell wall biosynthesis|nr:glycosyltransferase family 4 protein [Fusobacteriaceae bacterium]
MNILLIDHYAGSPELGMEFRPYYLAKEWVKQGHNVLIVGATYSHLRKKQPVKGKQNIDGINYYWIKTNQYKGNNGVGRILSMFLFIFKLFFFSKTYKDFNPNIVIASSTYPLDIYPAHKIAKRYHAKLIFEVHDLWPLSPIELGGYSKRHPFIIVMQWAENYAYKHTNAVVSILPKANKHMENNGLEKDKFYHIPNGIVISDWERPLELPEEHLKLLNELKEAKKFIIGFAGAHGIANSLDIVIKVIANLVNKNVVLVLVGTGTEKNRLQNYVKEKKISNVHFLPTIQKLQIPSFLKFMDALYIGLQKQPLFRFGISPNKIFDYMMAKKPIIQAIEAGNNIVKEANCGLYAEPDNIEEITCAICHLQEIQEEERRKLGENGYQYVMKYHTYDVLGKNFLNIMQNI